MKKHIVPLILMLLPMLLAAGAFEGRQAYDFDASQTLSRAWRLTQQLTSYKEGGDWIPSMRAFPHFNATYPARVDSMSMDSWDTEMNVWIPGIMKAYMTYNAAGRMIENTMYVNFGPMMFPMLKETASFDAQNRITHLYMYGGDFENPGNWIPSMRLHIIYGTGTSFQVYGWEEDSGMDKLPNYFHSTFTFDTQGRISQELSFTSPDSPNWVQDYRDDYLYHPQDSSTGADMIEHVAANLPMMLLNDGYTFPGLISSRNSQIWNGTGWVPDYRTTYQYDALLMLSQVLDEYHNGTAWMPDYQKLYHYDTNFQLSYTIGQYNEGSGFQDEERVDYTWEWYTSAGDDPVVPPAQLSVKAYPSPFTDMLRIETTSQSKGPVTVSIHNLRGQLVQSLQSSSGQSLTWDGRFADGSIAPAGIYLLKVQQNGFSTSAKVIRSK
jgi:hypothetical protein